MIKSEVKERDKEDNIMASVTEFILTRYNLKQGFEKFGKKAEEATKNELAQIHNMDALLPLDANKLLEQDKKCNGIVDLLNKKGMEQ